MHETRHRIAWLKDVERLAPHRKSSATLRDTHPQLLTEDVKHDPAS